MSQEKRCECKKNTKKKTDGVVVAILCVSAVILAGIMSAICIFL